MPSRKRNNNRPDRVVAILVIVALVLFAHLADAKGGGAKSGGGGSSSGSGGSSSSSSSSFRPAPAPVVVVGSGSSGSVYYGSGYGGGTALPIWAIVTIVVGSVGGCVACVFCCLKPPSFGRRKVASGPTTVPLMSKAGDLKTLEELAGPAAGSTENSYQNATNDSYKRAKKWEAARGVGPDTGRGPVPPHLLGAIVERNKTSGPGSAWRFIPEPGSEAAARVTVMDEGSGKQLVSFATPSSWAQGDTDVSVSTDLPLWYAEGEFTQSPFYYFEVTILSMTPSKIGTVPVVALGVSTSPYPPFRLPGWHPHSTAIHSDDGRLFVSDPFGGRNFAPPFGPSDVIGVGYYPPTGATFFTRNGQLILSGSGQGVSGWDGSLVPGDASYSVVWGEKTVHGIVGCDAGCVLKVDFTGPFRYPAGNPSWWRDGASRGWVPPPGGPHLPVVSTGPAPPMSSALPPYAQQGESSALAPSAPAYTAILGPAGPASRSNVPPPYGDGMGKA